MEAQTINILSIGNSFSQDAQAYLHKLAACGGVAAKTVNLYIGGCPLALHWENAQADTAAYRLEINGVGTGRNISIKDALCAERWDIITLQQASHDSGLPETYEPALSNLSQYVRQYAPQATQWVHQTWAYETDSTHPAFARYHHNQQEMHQALCKAYRKAADTIGAQLIPCGEVIARLRQHPAFDYAGGGLSLCRDGFHLSLTYGRYTAAAVWYAALLGGSLAGNSFVPPGLTKTPESEQLLQLIRQTVEQVCAKKEGA